MKISSKFYLVDSDLYWEYTHHLIKRMSLSVWCQKYWFYTRYNIAYNLYIQFLLYLVCDFLFVCLLFFFFMFNYLTKIWGFQFLKEQCILFTIHKTHFGLNATHSTWSGPGLEKKFISLQPSQNFPQLWPNFPWTVWHIYFPMYKFIFSVRIAKFTVKELAKLPTFSSHDQVTCYVLIVANSQLPDILCSIWNFMLPCILICIQLREEQIFSAWQELPN